MDRQPLVNINEVGSIRLVDVADTLAEQAYSSALVLASNHRQLQAC
jgi:hypothetical protein